MLTLDIMVLKKWNFIPLRAAMMNTMILFYLSSFTSCEPALQYELHEMWLPGQ